MNEHQIKHRVDQYIARKAIPIAELRRREVLRRERMARTRRRERLIMLVFHACALSIVGSPILFLFCASCAMTLLVISGVILALLRWHIRRNTLGG